MRALSTKIFKASFWMRKHLALTWKRTWMWATTVKTTNRTKGKDGKTKWQGNRNLKGTQ